MSYQILPPHGGYRKLLSYQLATIAFDFGLEFANKYMGPGLEPRSNRTGLAFR